MGWTSKNSKGFKALVVACALTTGTTPIASAQPGGARPGGDSATPSLSRPPSPSVPEKREPQTVDTPTKGPAVSSMVPLNTSPSGSSGAFVPLKAAEIDPELKRQGERKGTGVVSWKASVELEPILAPEATIIRFMVDVPKVGKPKVEIVNDKLVLPKSAILGAYDLSRSGRKPAVTQFFEAPVKSGDSWDFAVYTAKPGYVELELLKAGQHGAVFRKYVVPDPPTKEVRQEVEKHLMAYFWLATAASAENTQDRKAFAGLAEATLSQSGIQHFLTSYGQDR